MVRIRIRPQDHTATKSSGTQRRWRSTRLGLTHAAVVVLLVIVVAYNVLRRQHNKLNWEIQDTVARAMSPLRADAALLEKDGSAEVDAEGNMCRFYLAESAIPHGGLGLFTTVDLAPGDEAQSMPDICIYVADTPQERTHFETHSWARDVFFGTFEGNHPRAACEGFATLFNSMPPGVQTSKLHMVHAHTNGGLQRSVHPGAGSISHYYGISSVATRSVRAGSELTIDYGDWQYEPKRTYTAPTRTIPWLHKHGMCIDNIRVQQTKSGMGRGAFSSRSLPQDSLVAPAPIQVFANRTQFASQVPESVFVNYCFEVPGTSILLFPYGPGVNLINHSHQKPNVALRWSTHAMHHADWLDLPLEQFLQMDYPGGIILDVIALRDIVPGEELLLDYGAAWDSAWKRHVKNWKSIAGDDYVYAQDMDHSQPFKTVTEQRTDPYATNLQTVCWTPNWQRDDLTKMKWTEPKFDWPEGLVFCNILKRNIRPDGSLEYEVSLNFNESDPDAFDQKLYVDTAVPHSAIYFVDKPYTSDIHLKNGFRHPIELPRELIPPLWVKKQSA